MNTLRIAQLDGGVATVDGTVAESLGNSLRGELLAEKETGYDQARTIWNAMIDRR